MHTLTIKATTTAETMKDERFSAMRLAAPVGVGEADALVLAETPPALVLVPVTITILDECAGVGSGARLDDCESIMVA